MKSSSDWKGNGIKLPLLMGAKNMIILRIIRIQRIWLFYITCRNEQWVLAVVDESLTSTSENNQTLYAI